MVGNELNIAEVLPVERVIIAVRIAHCVREFSAVYGRGPLGKDRAQRS